MKRCMLWYPEYSVMPHGGINMHSLASWCILSWQDTSEVFGLIYRLTLLVLYFILFYIFQVKNGNGKFVYLFVDKISETRSFRSTDITEVVFTCAYISLNILTYTSFEWSASSCDLTIWLSGTHTVRYSDGYCTAGLIWKKTFDKMVHLSCAGFTTVVWTSCPSTPSWSQLTKRFGWRASWTWRATSAAFSFSWPLQSPRVKTSKSNRRHLSKCFRSVDANGLDFRNRISFHLLEQSTVIIWLPD